MRASDFRAKAKQTLKGNYWSAVLVAFVAGILGALIIGGGFSIDIDTETIQTLFGSVPRILVIYLAIAGTFASFLSIVQFVLGGVIQLGYCKYLLNQHDGQSADIKDLFSMFDMFKEGFLQALLRSIYTFLWALLFIIPGIVKSFSYAMTPFILLENPNMSAKEAITASKKLMDGHKGELFILGLSFIGWEFLCVLTCGIGYLFLNPYMNAAHAAFYRNLVPAKVIDAAPVIDAEPTIIEP